MFLGFANPVALLTPPQNIMTPMITPPSKSCGSPDQGSGKLHWSEQWIDCKILFLCYFAKEVIKYLCSSFSRNYSSPDQVFVKQKQKSGHNYWESLEILNQSNLLLPLSKEGAPMFKLIEAQPLRHITILTSNRTLEPQTIRNCSTSVWLQIHLTAIVHSICTVQNEEVLSEN